MNPNSSTSGNRSNTRFTQKQFNRRFKREPFSPVSHEPDSAQLSMRRTHALTGPDVNGLNVALTR